MTMYNEEQIESMKEVVVGKKITDLRHEDDGDYFVMDIEGGTEMSFRYMSDIANGQEG